MRAYLIGKGKSLDNVTPEWFDKDSPIWCLNQSATVIRNVLPNRELYCVQNDNWIDYKPPADVCWFHASRVPSQDHPNDIVYNIKDLTGCWASPTCMCALNLMKDYDEIVMVGFDSHFDNSRTYADVLNVKSDEIAPFQTYDTMMRRWAYTHGKKLVWVDSLCNSHEDDLTFRKAIVVVAMGDKYTKQTDGMIQSFLAFNPDWEVCKFYNEDLQNLLPTECRTWTAFNKCEIGRWYAMQRALDKYETVLYCDGDMKWYGKYEMNCEHAMTIYPHYVTERARQDAKHWLYKDGVANIGLMELSRHACNDRLFDFIIGEVIHNPNAFKHKDQLWLQNIVSCIPDCGFDAVYNNDGGYNVAFWNLFRKDREVFEQDGKIWVGTREDKLFPLVCFHFSGKSIRHLDSFGVTVAKLKRDYLNGQC